ncbi:enoyl-CoA hydratase/isomerase family protein [Hoeflea sp.]|uniref:enoyl-CoA hydratase/isomerase family protein n=1 Tax=Hoeflea sp. TaxID=1940281 RepID=UPI0019C926D2|nr:enoyl-CoA hydratase/isomerase family protein [Hoeflea sp.]MBC7284920.1 enoyl-CoA hydratase/isomerase family protein [Hoeflea sp.]
MIFPVETTRHDGVLRVCINRPEKRNALSMETLDAVAVAFDDATGDDELRLAVLTGRGDKSFAAGGDLKELALVKGEDAAVVMAMRAKKALTAVRNFPLPVVAALNGDALGGGAELAMACDMRVAASHARIGFIQGKLGITSAWGGGVDLMRLIGPARALQMMTRMEVLPPAEASAIGLYNATAGDGTALEDALEAFIAPMRSQSPHVMRSFKAMALHLRQKDREEMDRLETQNFGIAWAHPDHDRAVERLLNKTRAT